METNITEIKGLKRKLKLTIPSEQVQQSFSKNFKNIQRDAKIQGFRKGKAPLTAIKQNFYKKAWQAVMDDLFKSFYPKAILENKLQPVGQPTLLDITLEDTKPCTFLVELEVHPKVEVNNYLNLKIKQISTQVTDQHISKTLTQLQDSLKTKEKESPALDDQFAQKFKVQTLSELKLKIRKDLEAAHKQKAKEGMENELITKLVEANPIPDIPQSLVEKQTKSLIENAKKNLTKYGMKPAEQESWIKKQSDQFEKEARFSIHSGYLIEALIENLKLQVQKKDIEIALKTAFPSKKPEDMENELKKHNYWNTFLFNLSRQKAISFLMEKADISK